MSVAGRWVVTWQYSDGSGSGVVSIFDSEEEARALTAVLKIHGDTAREFSVEVAGPVPTGLAGIIAEARHACDAKSASRIRSALDNLEAALGLEQP